MSSQISLKNIHPEIMGNYIIPRLDPLSLTRFVKVGWQSVDRGYFSDSLLVALPKILKNMQCARPKLYAALFNNIKHPNESLLKIFYMYVYGVRLPFACGKRVWEKYFGKVGAEPPLPQNITEILQSPCPYWEGKTVEETHLLALIPQTVNGELLTLNSLQELANRPQGGGHATKCWCHKSVREEHGDRPLSSSYWVLITKDVIPNSRSKSYGDQQLLLKEPYTTLRTLEIAAALLIHHVKGGERLYTDKPRTYTRCLEQVRGKEYRVVVGSFGPSGLSVIRNDGRHDIYSTGLGGCWKF